MLKCGLQNRLTPFRGVYIQGRLIIKDSVQSSTYCFCRGEFS